MLLDIFHFSAQLKYQSILVRILAKNFKINRKYYHARFS